MLDTDYDGNEFIPGGILPNGWKKKRPGKSLQKNLKAEIDEELIEAYKRNGFITI